MTSGLAYEPPSPTFMDSVNLKISSGKFNHLGSIVILSCLHLVGGSGVTGVDQDEISSIARKLATLEMKVNFQ